MLAPFATGNMFCLNNNAGRPQVINLSPGSSGRKGRVWVKRGGIGKLRPFVFQDLIFIAASVKNIKFVPGPQIVSVNSYFGTIFDCLN